MVYVGKENLVGEVIGLKKGMTTVQVFEETTGLRPGETVTGTGNAEWRWYHFDVEGWSNRMHFFILFRNFSGNRNPEWISENGLFACRQDKTIFCSACHINPDKRYGM